MIKNEGNYKDKPGTNKIDVRVEGEYVVVYEPLYRSIDGKIVHENNKDARWLYATVGTRIPLAEAEHYGLVPKQAKDKK